MKLLKTFLLVLFAISGWLMLNCWLSFVHYNLYEDGKWQSGKTKLEKGVWGGWAMMFSNAALKGGELNINAWHGYQELTLADAVAAKSISFDFRPCHVPFSFIINKTDTGNTGIMFYPNDEKKVRFYTTNAIGKFLSIRETTLGIIPETTHGSVNMSFVNDSVKIYLNGTFAAAFPLKLPLFIHLGFKGSSEFKELYIDNFKVFDGVGKIIISEQFDYPFHIYGITYIYLFLWLIVLLRGLYIKRLSGFIVYAAFLLAVAITIAFGYYYYIGCGKYISDGSNINWHGIKSSIETDTAVFERVAHEYPVQDIAGKKQVVIVMGASQTWGAGASFANTTFPALLQDSLRSLYDTGITVINVAVSAISPQAMYQSYVQKWALYKPALLIVNASNNGIDTTVFKTKLQAIVDYNRAHKIKTLLIEGPSDGNVRLCEKDICLRTLAVRNNLTTIETGTYMHQYADSGYLWWDAVHLSDYGHFILTRRILPYVIAELKSPVQDSVNETERVAPIKEK